MTIASLDLASLLCSRLCHDLLSPVGALTNGLELLAEERDPEMRQKCFELLEQSAASSANKLRFFRLAFGAAGGFGEMVPVAEARGLVDALVAANPRVTVQWAMPDDMLPKAAIKTLLNLALIGMEALVRGGVLDIAGEVRNGASELVIRATGPRIAFDPVVGQALAGTLAPADLSSRTAPAAMLHQLAEGLGGGFQVHVAAEALVRLKDPAAEVSAHYLIDEDGTIVRLVDESQRAWHAGRAFWRGITDVNSASIGIELVNPGHEFGYRPFADAQMEALVPLLGDIVGRHDIPRANVVGHSDVAPARKQDPGELFDWDLLARYNLVLSRPRPKMRLLYDNEGAFFLALERFGYDVSDKAAAVAAFQRRWRPHKIDGEVDGQIGALLFELLLARDLGHAR